MSLQMKQKESKITPPSPWASHPSPRAAQSREALGGSQGAVKKPRHAPAGTQTPADRATGLVPTGLGAERPCRRQPSSRSAPKNAPQPPNPPGVPSAAGRVNCQRATACSLCGPAEGGILVAAKNEENWCVFVLFPFK